MENEEKLKLYQGMIADLDREHAEFLAQPIPQGNQAEVYRQVQKNAITDLRYREKRRQLEKAISDLTPVSPAVEAYLNPIKIYSKFDVLEGVTEPDNQLQGKEL